MLPLELFRRRDFTAAQVTALGVSASVFAGYLYLTVYLQSVVGLSPIQTGLAYLPGTFASFIVAAATTEIAARYSARVLLGVGMGLACAGLIVMVAMLQVDSGWLAFEPGLIVAMIGVGLINPVLSGLALGSLSEASSGLAAGINDTFRQGGIALGVALLGALVPSGANPVAGFVHGLHVALLVAAGLLLAGAVAVVVMLADRRTDEPAKATSRPVPSGPASATSS